MHILHNKLFEELSFWRELATFWRENYEWAAKHNLGSMLLKDSLECFQLCEEQTRDIMLKIIKFTNDN